MSVPNPRMIKNSNISNTKKIYCVIQWDRKAGELSNNEFTMLHHLVLKTFWILMSLKLRNLIVENINKRSIERSLTVISSWWDIIKFK